MREFKFRFWNKRNKKFKEYLAIDSNDDLLLTEVGFFANRGSYIVSQYTGLKDKDKKEIFEGDIIESLGVKSKIVFCEGKFIAFNENDDGYLERIDLSDIAYSCKVIGNIFQNPELLEK